MAGIRRHHTRRLQSVMLAAACFLLSSKAARAALPDDSRWHASATLAAGTKTARLTLNITEAPAPGDSIQVTVSTTDVATVLATPSSKNITKQSAAEGGFRWIQGPAGPAPLGSDDPGQITRFVFNRAATPGQYVVNFTFSKLQVPARVEVHFTSRMKDFVDLIQQTPDARILGPVKLAPAARLSFDLPQDLENQVIDIVVPDATVTVELTLPEGRILRQSTLDPSQGEWNVFAESEDDQQPPFFFALDITLPLEGTHHFIQLKDAPKGRYEIHAQSGATSGGNLTLAVLPFAALAKASGAIMRTCELPAAGEVKIRPKPLPSECYAGEKLEVRVELLGDIGTQTPQFEVRLERRPWVSETTSGAKLAPPDPVETLPVEFTQEGERTYRGLVTLSKVGSVRISVRANGETSRGQRFTDEALITNGMKVKPVVAKFLSLGGKAVRAADSEKFDHLEISAKLQVIEAGDYLANFMLRDASGTRLQGGGVSTRTRLEKGPQTLTVSVPSAQIWHELRDGPIEIASVQIWRTSLSQLLWVEVPTDGASFRTASYKRDQWDRGPIFGNDQLNVHGIAAAPSGQFLYVEAEWEVTTPGGSCEWYGSLDRMLTAPFAKDTVRTLQAFERAKLPAGRTKISFLFDGPEIQESPAQQEWRLSAGLRCARSESNLPDLTFVLIPPQQIRLNPEEYEPRSSSIVIHVSPMRLVQSGFGRTTVSVSQRVSHEVQFSLGELPKGMDAQLRMPEGDSKPASRQLLIETSAHIAPGRYFIPIIAVTGDEKTTTLWVLDIDSY